MPLAIADLGLVDAERRQVELERNPEWQALEWIECERSVWYWLENYVWTFDVEDRRAPRKRFPRYRYLRKLVALYQAHLDAPGPDQDILVEKARRALFSILMGEFALHGLQFRGSYMASLMSFVFRKIDDGGKQASPSSIMGKMLQTYRKQPDWMKWQAPLLPDNWKSGSITNPLTGANVSADVARLDGGSSTRGGGVHEAFIDEAGVVPHLDLILGSVMPMAGFTMLGGTPNGEGTDFEGLCKDTREDQGRPANERKTSFNLVEIDWWDIPDHRRCRNCGSAKMRQPTEEDRSGIEHKGDDCKATDGFYWDDVEERFASPWFREQQRKLSPQMVRQELERIHASARPWRIWASFKRDETFVHERFDYAPDGDHVASWDFGIDGATSIGFGRRNGAFLTLYDDYENNEEYTPHYCNFLAWVRGEFHEWAVDGKSVGLDSVAAFPREAVAGRCWLPDRDRRSFERQWGEPGRWRGMRLAHIGDPAGMARDSAGGSWFVNLAKGAEWTVNGEMRRVGRINMAPAYQRHLMVISKDEMIQAVDYMLAQRKMGLNPRCKWTIRALLNYHRHANRQGELVTGKGPVHDEFSHSADRLQYMCIFCFGKIGIPVAASR